MPRTPHTTRGLSVSNTHLPSLFRIVILKSAFDVPDSVQLFSVLIFTWHVLREDEGLQLVDGLGVGMGLGLGVGVGVGFGFGVGLGRLGLGESPSPLQSPQLPSPNPIVRRYDIFLHTIEVQLSSTSPPVSPEFAFQDHQYQPPRRMSLM